MRAWLPLLALMVFPLAAEAAELAKDESKLPFRTDVANARLPWYQLKPGEFPPRHSEHRITGELVEADFIHRCGQFRTDRTGELVNFKLLPCGVVRYLNADADLRDVPLGTLLTFSLYQDEHSAFTRAAVISDDFSDLVARGVTYRLDEIYNEYHSLSVTPQMGNEAPADLAQVILRANDQTRIWKGNRQIPVRDLAAGDSFLANRVASANGNDTPLSDIWVGTGARESATHQQRKRHTEFLKERGLPGWIDRVEGKTFAVTLFGDPDDLRAILKAEGIDPAQWAKEHRFIRTVVANQDLRSYNPPVDGQGSTTLEYHSVPTDGYGCCGISWVIQPSLMLEGFRKGSVVRLFAQPSWPVHDMPFGEGVYTETPNAKVEEESLNQYPFRTDFGNENLPWYQLKPGEFPPYQSQHTVGGELTKIDTLHRSGQFRADRVGELIDFTMPPFGSALYHKAEADLGDLPLGTHYWFLLHPDQKGAFNRATLIIDDFTRATNDRVTYRVEAVNLHEGALTLARQLGPMKDERDHMVKPPDLGRGEFAVDEKTRVWKGDATAQLSDLAVGDEVLVNLTGRTTSSRGRCTEIWAGLDTHKNASDRQRRKHNALLKSQGLPAWVERVEGKEVTIVFFSASRRDFPSILDGDPWGKSVQTVLVDEELQAQARMPVKMGFKNHLPEGNTAGTYGCSGVRWVLESPKLPAAYQQGQILRVSKEAWLNTIPEEKH
jgi:hypothetical protein